MSDRKSSILPFFLRHYVFLCLRYYLFSVFVIAQPIIRLFKMQKSIIKKKQKIKFSHKEINVIWDGSLF